MFDLILPLLLTFVSLWGLRQKEDVYSHFLAGAEDGIRTLFGIAPSLILLLTAVGMMRESGGFDLLSNLFAPVLGFFKIPAETAPLLLIRPFSGSAALAVGTELMVTHGVDSLIGKTAAVMLGSTETTFYAISVYFGATGVKKTRYAIPAALTADAVGFFTAALTARFLA
ncbi:MAG: spore maturation protein [Oscillospiraceae bacterium]|nr:spore maturation protein [Oscillospiraceae bacterium]